MCSQLASGMDALGEVIIGNKIYSARYAQPPRSVHDGPNGAATDDGWLQPRRRNDDETPLMTTDLDELPTSGVVVVEEPHYINLTNDDEVPCGGKSSSGRKVFTNTYGREENIYEEINELQRRLALEQQQQTVSMATQQQTTSSSLVDEVMDEVARVRLGHDTVLNQLNLDLEHFLKPQTPEPSPPPPPDQQQLEDSGNIKDRSRSIDDRPCEVTTTGRLPRKSHNRSNSSVSFTMSQWIGAGERSLVRCESLDLVHDGSSGVCRRPSTVSRGSTSTSSSVSGKSDPRQSIRNLHQGFQHGIQGLADWTEKCGHMLAKRSKKVISFVNKG